MNYSSYPNSADSEQILVTDIGASPEQLLNAYIYDYLVKSGLSTSSQAFFHEANVVTSKNGLPVNKNQVNEAVVPKIGLSMDAPGGFLFEWWSIFWDVFNASQGQSRSQKAQYYHIMEAQRRFERLGDQNGTQRLGNNSVLGMKPGGFVDEEKMDDKQDIKDIKGQDQSNMSILRNYQLQLVLLEQKNKKNLESFKNERDDGEDSKNGGMASGINSVGENNVMGTNGSNVTSNSNSNNNVNSTSVGTVAGSAGAEEEKKSIQGSPASNGPSSIIINPKKTRKPRKKKNGSLASSEPNSPADPLTPVIEAGMSVHDNKRKITMIHDSGNGGGSGSGNKRQTKSKEKPKVDQPALDRQPDNLFGNGKPLDNDVVGSVPNGPIGVVGAHQVNNNGHAVGGEFSSEDLMNFPEPGFDFYFGNDGDWNNV